MSVQLFREKLTHGGARPNQFRVILPEPTATSPFLCDAASLPGQTVDVLPVFYRGREVKLPGERRFDNWIVSVINDENFAIHRFLSAWMERINNKETNSGDVNSKGYTLPLIVQQLSRRNNGEAEGSATGILRHYKFNNAWPTNIQPIQLNFSDNNNVSRFQVEFAYDYFDEIQDNIASD